MSTRRRRVRILGLLLTLVLGVLTVVPADPAGAATRWYVAPTGDDSSDCRSAETACATINGAIDKASRYDTVLVLPGTYVEHVDYQGKRITVESQQGPDATVIDGGGIDVCVFMELDGVLAALRGFTITNCLHAAVRAYGGTPFIVENRVVGNVSLGGGVIEVRDSMGIVRRNVVAGNTGPIAVEVSGAGEPQILLNTIRNNASIGIDLNGGTPIVSGNIVEGNTGFGGPGGGIQIDSGSNAVVTNNLIVGNKADREGGGIYVLAFGEPGPMVFNNTLAFNEAPIGAEISFDGANSVSSFVNNIVVGTSDQPILYCQDSWDTTPPTVQFNDVINLGSGGEYGGLCTDQTGINGNISADPLFLDTAAGDYHLTIGSPAVDTGANPIAPTFDFDGDPRPIDGDGNGVATADMGFDEYSPFVEQARLLPADVGEEDHFSSAVAVDGDTVVAGRILDDHAGERSGSAYVFVRSGTLWSEQAKLTASDAGEFDMFGGAVAIDGDTIVVGRREDYRSGKPGAAYVFVRSGTTWSEQAKLTGPGATVSDGFGFSVAISGDTIVVGSFDRVGAGSAHVFVRSGTTWSEQAELTASPAVAGDEFGFSVGIDGDTIVVGARNDNPARFYSGSAHVFTRSGTTWSQQARLTAADPVEWDFFGNAVAISGELVVVSAPERYGDGFYGVAYVFARDGSSWSEEAILRGSGFFGGSMAIDGESVVIGAPLGGGGQSISFPVGAGAAFVFDRGGATWLTQARLIGSEAETDDVLGDAVAISEGTVVIAGGGATLCCPEVIHSGGVYVFERQRAVNQPPTADAGSDELIEWSGGDVGVTLDGSGSSDPDGDTLSYSWTGGFREGSASGVAPTVTFDDLGDYEITLTVDDGRGGTDADTVGITVAAYCGGLPATIIGNLGDDILVGTESADVIVGLDGDDVIHAGGGNDVVCGGPGADRLRGQGGNDKLIGNEGPDLIVGGGGRDMLIGSDGSDVLKGQGGKDRLHGSGGDDRLFGGGNSDRLNGGAGTDYAHGGGGTDKCSAETMVACE